MLAVIDPGRISGNIQVPASKSVTQRVLAAALLHKGKTIITHMGRSDDEQAALNVVEQLGARIYYTRDNAVEITSEGVYPAQNTVFCGESGLAARLFIPIAALSNKTINIEGRGSLLRRPFDVYTKVLPQLNITLHHMNGKLPFTVRGPLQPGNISLDGSVSSQFLSGLLFALSYEPTVPITIQVHELKSKPYIDLTLQVLEHFGKKIQHEGYNTFHISPQNFTAQKEVTCTIEGDWSSAALLMTGAALAGEVGFTGLNLHSLQADKAILQALQMAGAVVSASEKEVRVMKNELRAFDFDATHCPDLFPALAILAACCSGASHINGIHRLLHKESNRVESICDMLEAFGVFHSVEDDALYIEGGKTLEPGDVYSHKDHRIAMAAAIGALRAYDRTYIQQAGVVAKSYPDFFTDLQKLGAFVRLNY